MNKETFLRRLEELLAAASDDERSAALEYYGEYLDEAGPEKQAELIAEWGGADKIAADILASSGGVPAPPPGADKKASAGTSDGDEKQTQPTQLLVPPIQSDTRRETSHAGYNRRNTNIAKIILFALLAIFLLPLLAGVGGVLIGVLVVLFVVFFIPFILGIAFVGAGILSIIAGALAIPASVGTGLFALGSGILLVGLGLMCFYGGVRLLGSTLPRIIRSVINGIGGLFRAIFGKLRLNPNAEVHNG